uniref:Uncharacterized protein n=1 Tax=Globodera rostochiensis TaxID=31243 RepID=A0A914HNT0_GLORO
MIIVHGHFNGRGRRVMYKRVVDSFKIVRLGIGKKIQIERYEAIGTLTKYDQKVKDWLNTVFGDDGEEKKWTKIDLEERMQELTNHLQEHYKGLLGQMRGI